MITVSQFRGKGMLFEPGALRLVHQHAEMLSSELGSPVKHQDSLSRALPLEMTGLHANGPQAAAK